MSGAGKITDLVRGRHALTNLRNGWNTANVGHALLLMV